MVMPRAVRERRNKHQALLRWDERLHETLSELRDALKQIKEMDTDARTHPPEKSR